MYLNSGFSEIDFDGQFFAEKDIRIMSLVEGVFQLLQLEIGESRPKLEKKNRSRDEWVRFSTTTTLTHNIPISALFSL